MLNDIRYAFRALRQSPGFAVTAIVSIALAIGANSAIFSFVDGLIFRPLPVSDAGGVVSLRSISPSSSATSLAETGTGISYPDFVDFRDRNHSFDGLVAYTLKAAGFAKDEHSQAQLRMGYVVTGNFFQVLGVETPLGRAFRPEEDQVPERRGYGPVNDSSGVSRSAALSCSGRIVFDHSSRGRHSRTPRGPSRSHDRSEGGVGRRC